MMKRNQPGKETRESVFQAEMSDAEDPKAARSLTLFWKQNWVLWLEYSKQRRDIK